MDKQRPASRRRPSLLSEFERHNRPRSNWLGEQPDAMAPNVASQRVQQPPLPQQTHLHQAHIQQQQQPSQQPHQLNLQRQVVATGVPAHAFQSVVGLPHLQQVAMTPHNVAMHNHAVLGSGPVLQVASVQPGSVAGAVAVAAMPSSHQAHLASGQGALSASGLHRPALAQQTSNTESHQVAALGAPTSLGQCGQQSPSKTALNPAFLAASDGKAPVIYSALQTVGSSSPVLSTSVQRVHERASLSTQTKSGLLPTPLRAARGSSALSLSQDLNQDGSETCETGQLPAVEAVSPASVGEEESDNDSVDHLPKSSPQAGSSEIAGTLCMPSPQFPPMCKEDLMAALDRLDREISKTEQKLNMLRESKKAALTRQTSQQDNGTGSDVQGTLLDQIYAENKRKAEEAHKALRGVTFKGSTTSRPLYSKPSDLSVYHDILRKRVNVLPRLVRFLHRAHEEQRLEDERLTDRYESLQSEWQNRIEAYESQPKKKAKDAKAREIFEKHFPDLKKMRERTQRITRLGSRGTHGGAARTEAELNEIMDSLAEMDELENPERSRQGAATIPPMVGFQDKHRIRFVQRNSVLRDPSSFVKEWHQRVIWMEEEKQIFRDKYVLYPKGFSKISAFLPNKSTKDCVLYYYRSKKTEKYKRLLRKYSKRLRQQQRIQNQQQEQERQFQLLEKQQQEQLEERQRQQDASAAQSISGSLASAANVILEGKWSEKEIQSLKEGIISHGQNWETVAEFMQPRTAEECKLFYEKHGRTCHLQYALRTYRNRQKRQAAAEERVEVPAVDTAAEDNDEEVEKVVVDSCGVEKSPDNSLTDLHSAVSAAMPAPYIHDSGPIDRHAIDLVMATAADLPASIPSNVERQPAVAGTTVTAAGAATTSAVPTSTLAVAEDDTPTPEGLLAAVRLPLLISPLSPVPSPQPSPTSVQRPAIDSGACHVDSEPPGLPLVSVLPGEACSSSLGQPTAPQPAKEPMDVAGVDDGVEHGKTVAVSPTSPHGASPCEEHGDELAVFASHQTAGNCDPVHIHGGVSGEQPMDCEDVEDADLSHKSGMAETEEAALTTVATLTHRPSSFLGYGELEPVSPCSPSRAMYPPVSSEQLLTHDTGEASKSAICKEETVANGSLPLLPAQLMTASTIAEVPDCQGSTHQPMDCTPWEASSCIGSAVEEAIVADHPQGVPCDRVAKSHHEDALPSVSDAVIDDSVKLLAASKPNHLPAAVQPAESSAVSDTLRLQPCSGSGSYSASSFLVLEDISPDTSEAMPEECQDVSEETDAGNADATLSDLFAEGDRVSNVTVTKPVSSNIVVCSEEASSEHRSTHENPGTATRISASTLTAVDSRRPNYAGTGSTEQTSTASGGCRDGDDVFLTVTTSDQSPIEHRDASPASPDASTTPVAPCSDPGGASLESGVAAAVSDGPFLGIPAAQSSSRRSSADSVCSTGMLVELHDPTSPSLLDT